MNEELKVLEIVSQRLEQANIPYMITGSTAMNYYATPRMTRDIDLVAELKKPDIPKLVKLFDKDFYIDAEMIKDALQSEGMFNIIHNEWIVKVDFIIKKISKYSLEAFKRRKKVKVLNFNFWIISPEDLIISKLNWAKDSMSELQLRDVRNMLECEEILDFKYIEKWIQQHSLEKVYEKIKR